MQRGSAVRGVFLYPVLAMAMACAHSPGDGESIEAQDSGPVRVQSLLSMEEFREAGLDRLSDQEIDALNKGLSRALGRDSSTDGADAAALAAWDASEDNPFATFGMGDEHPRARAEDQMRAELAESISEWRGGTRFRLKNGQTWEVAGSSATSLPAGSAGDALIIRRGVMGSFRMSLEGSNRRVNVRRRE